MLTKPTLVKLSTMCAAAATNDPDINDIFGKGGSHTAPNTVQTGGGSGQRSGQGSAQSGGQRPSQSGEQTGGQSAPKPSSGTQSLGSAFSGSAGTNFGQGMQSSHLSCIYVACIRSNPCSSNWKNDTRVHLTVLQDGNLCLTDYRLTDNIC